MAGPPLPVPPVTAASFLPPAASGVEAPPEVTWPGVKRELGELATSAWDTMGEYSPGYNLSRGILGLQVIKSILPGESGGVQAPDADEIERQKEEWRRHARPLVTPIHESEPYREEYPAEEDENTTYSNPIPEEMPRLKGFGEDRPEPTFEDYIVRAVKEKGGNWQKDAIEYNLDKLKPHVEQQESLREGGYRNNREKLEYLQKLAKMAEKVAPDDTAAVQQDIQRIKPKAAIERWIDGPLTSYVRNDLGTAHDPLIKLADEGNLHISMQDDPMYAGQWDTQYTLHSQGYGTRFPSKSYGPDQTVAQTEEGRQWEMRGDRQILAEPVSRVRDKAERSMYEFETYEPWMRDLEHPEDVTTYYLNPGINTALGFRHMLQNAEIAMTPDADVPEKLRINPDKFYKMPIEQVAAVSAAIDLYAAEQAKNIEIEALRSNINQTSFLDVPEANMKWIEIPDTAEKVALDLACKLGKEGGWCTQHSEIAEDYGSGEGKKRLYVLIDKDEGRPFAQIAAKPAQWSNILSNPDRWAKTKIILKEAADYLDENFDDKNLRLMDHTVTKSAIAEATDLLRHHPQFVGQVLDSTNPAFVEENILYLIEQEFFEGDDENLPIYDLDPVVTFILKNHLTNIFPEINNPDIQEMKPPENTWSETKDGKATRSGTYIQHYPNFKENVQHAMRKFLEKVQPAHVNDLSYSGSRDLNQMYSNKLIYHPDRVSQKTVTSGIEKGPMPVGKVIDRMKNEFPDVYAKYRFEPADTSREDHLDNLQKMRDEAGFANGGLVAADFLPENVQQRQMGRHIPSASERVSLNEHIKNFGEAAQPALGRAKELFSPEAWKHELASFPPIDLDNRELPEIDPEQLMAQIPLTGLATRAGQGILSLLKGTTLQEKIAALKTLPPEPRKEASKEIAAILKEISIDHQDLARHLQGQLAKAMRAPAPKNTTANVAEKLAKKKQASDSVSRKKLNAEEQAIVHAQHMPEKAFKQRLNKLNAETHRIQTEGTTAQQDALLWDVLPGRRNATVALDKEHWALLLRENETKRAASKAYRAQAKQRKQKRQLRDEIKGKPQKKANGGLVRKNNLSAADFLPKGRYL